MPRKHSSVTTIARRPRNPKRAANKVQSMRAQLADCLIAEDLSEAVKVLRGTLQATKHQNISKFSSIEVPDHGSRIAAAKLILEYAVGKPMTTEGPPETENEDEPVRGTDTSEVVSRLKSSGLNLFEIVEAYDAETGEALDDEDFQAQEDARVASEYDRR